MARSIFKIQHANSVLRERVVEMVRRHPDYLGNSYLPRTSELELLVKGSRPEAACALKVYGPKLAEVRLVPLSATWNNIHHETVLAISCILKAKKLDIRQLLVTADHRHENIFKLMGFKPFNKEKFAMLKDLDGQDLFFHRKVPGIVFCRARREHWQGIVDLAHRYPEQILQPEDALFPNLADFFVALCEGDVIGASALTVFRRKLHQRSEMAEVRSVMVAEEFEGKGIGRELVARCINRAIGLEVRESLAITGKDTWFAKHFGFKKRREGDRALFLLLDELTEEHLESLGRFIFQSLEVFNQPEGGGLVSC